jgi:hypothetical protein
MPPPDFAEGKLHSLLIRVFDKVGVATFYIASMFIQ